MELNIASLATQGMKQQEAEAKKDLLEYEAVAKEILGNRTVQAENRLVEKKQEVQMAMSDFDAKMQNLDNQLLEEKKAEKGE